MTIQREPIYAALFALVSSVQGLKTTSRKLKHWNDVQASAMPALFQAQTAQMSNGADFLPVRWTLGALLYLYVSTKGADNPGSVVNPIVDAITHLFEPNAVGGGQTLGGLVQWARIGGTIETSEGTLDNLEVIQIPIHMLAL
ncbi:hypothetical protein GCM10008023_05950 [Sphingomonas glacialis]|uniref:DUF1834 family protein n=1 Tax=Sphingomonas glacialis TaxID=658225 RepID=A0ABQ3LD89_9SPHN|nr:hypothetical protein [Sphingomonas glacialis]GHH09360.1 hypothetical protein GCM10008023_05950 [Sphingomonas glacialis]